MVALDEDGQGKVCLEDEVYPESVGLGLRTFLLCAGSLCLQVCTAEDTGGGGGDRCSCLLLGYNWNHQGS